jgi:hypothetical protein
VPGFGGPQLCGPAILATPPGLILDSPRFSITALAFDPTSPNVIYASSGRSIFRTGNDYTWTQGALPAESAAVSALAVDPLDHHTIFAGTAGSGALRSTDLGVSWSSINAGLPEPLSVRAIVFSSTAPGTLYIGTDAGVFRSLDSGDHWTAFNDGLTNLDVTSLAIDPTGQFLHAGTNGGGVFDIELAPSPCSDPHTLCLQGGRFNVSVQWTDFQGNTGFGSVVSGASSTNSGVMWFFSPSNWELLIKVLNGCGVNGHYWVFGAAATDVEYTIQVTDTQTGEVRTYTNPLGTTSPAITDAAAFAACP